MKRLEEAKKNQQSWFRGQPLIADSLDPEFEEISYNFLCGDILAYGSLSQEQRALIILVALTTCQTLAAIPKYTLASLDMGAKPTEIKEALYQCAPYIGIEKVTCALHQVNRALQDAGITYPQPPHANVTEKTRFEKGLTIQQQIFGEGNINAMREETPLALKMIQDYLSAYCFGDFYTRSVLDLKMRELITFCAICCLGGCEPQVKAHVGANLSVGNTRQILIEAITQCLPFIGFPRALNAIACINAVTESQQKG